MNMTSRSISLLVSLALVACTHRQRVSALPRDLVGEVVELTLRDGTKINARAELTPSGIVWRTQDRSSVPSGTLREVSEVSHGQGALDGFGIGAATGISAGILLGLAADDTCDDPDVDGFCLGKQDIMLISGVVLGGGLGLIGLLIGAAVGARVVYEIDGPGGPAVRPGGPAGSIVGASLAF